MTGPGSQAGRTIPVAPSPGALGSLQTLDAAARITGGFWSTRQAINGSVSLRLAQRHLEGSGALPNLRRLATGARGGHQGEMNQDAEVYKWLEAASYEVARTDDTGLRADLDAVVGTIVAAQDPDGYLHSWHQLQGRHDAFREGLRTGGPDETYVAGHLFHAAVAHHRATGDHRLVDVAERLADRVGQGLGAIGPGAVSGHPGIEMGLVELYRLTGAERHLALAVRLVADRGHGWLGDHRFGSSHYQDYLPLREMPTLTGHVVAALYLACGATDVAVETHDDVLLSVIERQWQAVMGHKAYLTGGLGSRHRNEDLGDDFELPPDRAYAETCASVASIMWSWRLLLATGRPRYADAIERTLFNGLLVGVSLAGDAFFYGNTLQVRSGHRTPADVRALRRSDWFWLACCPPNLMRLLASLGHYVATGDASGVQVHQLADGHIDWPESSARLEVRTDYPWGGRVALRHSGEPALGRTLSVRVPAWATGARVWMGDLPSDVSPGAYATIVRDWRDGDQVILDLPLAGRYTVAHPRVDAVRGCVAVERGPLVYCAEQQDQTADLDDLAVDPSAPPADATADPVLGVVPLHVTAAMRDPGAWVGHIYRPLQEAASDRPGRRARTRLRLIPYFAWGNRYPGQMRVWLPVDRDDEGRA